ncbi:MAG: hypothetical protein PUB07_06380 [Clostridia bacterium]|nr:hypothetical protein [Clostridia bacterium]
MKYEKIPKVGRDPRSVPTYRPDIEGDMSNPERIHQADVFDSDYIWDGESMDEEKP